MRTANFSGTGNEEKFVYLVHDFINGSETLKCCVLRGRGVYVEWKRDDDPCKI